jgi:RNA polymerase sigma-70 factor (ECF subfamily)
MTDQEIAQGIKNGDEEAFRELVDTNQEMVLNVCNSFVHNKDDALDIAQEVFIKVYNSFDKFQGKSKISSWLYRIAVNKSLNFIRDKKRKNIFNSLDLIFENSPNNSENLEDSSENSQEAIENEETKTILQQTINELPKKQQTAIVLNKYENLSYKEIAEVMNISLSETGVLINRAKKKLQDKLIKKLKPNKK